MFGVLHKPSEYNVTPAPPWGWSGGGLVPPWTCPIPIDPPPNAVCDQANLSKVTSRSLPSRAQFRFACCRDTPQSPISPTAASA